MSKDFDQDQLKIHLSMLSDAIKTSNSTSAVTKVTSIQTVADTMNGSEIYKVMLGTNS